MQISANGITLEYESHGAIDGVPLVLIRGLGTHLTHWPAEFTGGLAARGFRVITFDNRDVGLSARCPDPDASGDADEILAQIAAGKTPRAAYGLDDMARDVIGLMDALEIARAHVFGVSLGGAITQVLTMNHPERLLTAHIVMTAASLGDDPSRLDRLLARPQGMADYVASALQEDRDWGSHGYPAEESYLRQQAETAHARGVDAAGINRQLLAAITSGDRRQALARVTLPCQVIHGAIDTLIPPDAGREIASLIPEAELHIIDGMGHVITPALSPLMVELVADFIARRG